MALLAVLVLAIEPFTATLPDCDTTLTGPPAFRLPPSTMALVEFVYELLLSAIVIAPPVKAPNVLVPLPPIVIGAEPVESAIESLMEAPLALLPAILSAPKVAL